MMVFLFRLPFLRPFGFPDSPFFQECAFGGFLKAFLPVFERFDQAVDRRDDFLLLCHIKLIRVQRPVRVCRSGPRLRANGLALV